MSADYTVGSSDEFHGRELRKGLRRQESRAGVGPLILSKIRLWREALEACPELIEGYERRWEARGWIHAEAYVLAHLRHLQPAHGPE